MGEQKNTTCAASILMVTSGKVYILGQNAPICHTETKTFQKCIHIKYFLILSRLIYSGRVQIWECFRRVDLVEQPSYTKYWRWKQELRHQRVGRWKHRTFFETNDSILTTSRENNSEMRASRWNAETFRPHLDKLNMHFSYLALQSYFHFHKINVYTANG